MKNNNNNSQSKKRKDGANTTNNNKYNNNNKSKKKVKHTMKFAPSRGLKPSQSNSKLYATTQELLECEISEVQRILSDAFSPDRPDALRADPRAFTMFSTRLRKQKQWEKCVEVFNLQKLLGVERNTISFNAVMSAAIKGGNPKFALGLFAEMKEIGLDITTITINVAMQAYLKLNEPNKALELFDALVEKNDTVSLNTAMAAAEMAGDNDRLAQLRNANSNVEVPVENGKINGDDDEENDSSSSSTSSSSTSSEEENEGDEDDDDDDDEEEEEEERRLRMKKMKKKKQQRKEEEEEEERRKKSLDVETNDEDDPDLALRKRRDARRKKFEEKRRLRKLKKGKERQWTSAAAHTKQTKSELQLKRSKMKGNPKDWLNEDEESSSSDDEDEEEEDSDTETRMRKWREKMQRKGLKSSIEDEKIDKYINVHSSSHGMDSEDFWKAGF